ncbi:MAG: TonB-dependent receptor [Planctomycetota bacterium]
MILRPLALAPLLSVLAPLPALAVQTGGATPPEDPPASAPASRQDGASVRATPNLDLGTTVVTPTGNEESILDVPYTVQRVDRERIEFLRTVPQTLRDVPGVLVQETGTGQGSPFIRGFTGFRTLFLVDGIRINNSTFRSGPNQYAGTIDALGLSGVEVVKGPSSVLYGSDAIGGTVNLLTKDPSIRDRPFGGRVFTRIADGANYNIQRAEFCGAVAGDTFWQLGVTRKDFGDMESGDGELPNTGYDEWDGDLKVQHLLDERSRFTFMAQRVDIDDAPRTHRTVFAVPFEGSGVGSDLRRDFDQDRFLTYGRYERDAVAVDDWSIQATLSYQRQEELRNRITSGGARRARGFDAQTYGLLLKGVRETSFGRLTTGVEWYRDHVDSFQNRFAAQTPVLDIQGPVADDALYDLGGAYADLAFDVTDSTTLTAGARFTYAAADANEVLDPETDTQISIDDSWTALTGSLRFETRIVEDADRTVALFGGISQGFRAPSLSDLTRLDDSRSNVFEVPSPGLEPEDFIAYELGVKHEAGDMSFQLAAFLTEGDDVIQRVRTGDVIGTDDETIKANSGEITIGGVEFGFSYDVTEEITAFGNVTWLDGQQEIVDTVGQPSETDAPSRLMPLTTLLGARLAPKDTDWYAELRWTHAEDADRLANSDERDTTRIPPGGTPGYDVLDLVGRWNATEDVSLLFGVENITDENYRVHGSGQNRPGRNLLFGVSVAF